MTAYPILLAAFLAASPAASSPASPDRSMLDSFKAACARTGELAAMKTDALAAGWEEVAEDADPERAIN